MHRRAHLLMTERRVAVRGSARAAAALHRHPRSRPRRRGVRGGPVRPRPGVAPQTAAHVTGAINGIGIRSVIDLHDSERGFTVGPAWLRDAPGSQSAPPSWS
jgi:hypothetical protein